MLAARRAGREFEEWWEEAVRPERSLVLTSSPCPPAGAVRWPSDHYDRVTWRGAILASKAGWRRAFYRERATVQEAALRFLAPGLRALDDVAEERALAELAAPAGIEQRAGLRSAA